MVSEAQEPQETIRCPSCGHDSLAWRTYCERCRTRLPKPEPPLPERPAPAPVVRPGCVTAFAVLFVIGALAASAAGSMGLVGLTRGSGGSSVGLVVGGLLALGLCLLLANGLWRMRNWARWLAMALGSVLVLFSLLSVLAGSTLLVIVGLVAGGGLLYWFAVNGYRFR